MIDSWCLLDVLLGTFLIWVIASWATRPKLRNIINKQIEAKLNEIIPSPEISSPLVRIHDHDLATIPLIDKMIQNTLRETMPYIEDVVETVLSKKIDVYSVDDDKKINDLIDGLRLEIKYVEKHGIEERVRLTNKTGNAIRALEHAMTLMMNITDIKVEYNFTIPITLEIPIADILKKHKDILVNPRAVSYNGRLSDITMKKDAPYNAEHPIDYSKHIIALYVIEGLDNKEMTFTLQELKSKFKKKEKAKR